MTSSVTNDDLRSTGEPKRKRRRIQPQPLKEPKTTETRNNHEEVPFFYALHTDPSIVIYSCMDEVKVDVDFDYDEKNHGSNVIDTSHRNFFTVSHPAPSLSSSSSSSSTTLALCESRLHSAASAIRQIASNSRCLIIAGAGMGIDSGLPDYRSEGGFWRDYAPLRKAGVTLHGMSERQWFLDDPASATAFYRHRYALYQSCIPHRGFQYLRKITQMFQDYFVLTSNIDGQFQLSGQFSDTINHRICETHGSLSNLQCIQNCKQSTLISTDDCKQWMDLPGTPSSMITFIEKIKTTDNINDNEDEIESSDHQSGDTKCHSSIPKCHHCNSVLRPNVSFFDDNEHTFCSDAYINQHSDLQEWLHHCKPNKLVIIEIGCGTSLHSLRWETQYLKDSLLKATVIRINPTLHHPSDDQSKKSQPSLSSSSDGCGTIFHLQTGALDGLQQLWSSI